MMDTLGESLAIGGSAAFAAFRDELGTYVHGTADEPSFLRVVTGVLAELRQRRLPPERVISALEAMNCRPTMRGESGNARGYRYTRALDVMLTEYYRPTP